jgi:hypothetical protein
MSGWGRVETGGSLPQKLKWNILTKENEEGKIRLYLLNIMNLSQYRTI